MVGAGEGAGAVPWGRAFQTLVSPAAALGALDSTCPAGRWGERQPHRRPRRAALDTWRTESLLGVEGAAPRSPDRAAALTAVETALEEELGALAASSFHRCRSPGVPKSGLAAVRLPQRWRSATLTPWANLVICAVV